MTKKKSPIWGIDDYYKKIYGVLLQIKGGVKKRRKPRVTHSEI
jgi:hypothetical protein